MPCKARLAPRPTSSFVHDYVSMLLIAGFGVVSSATLVASSISSRAFRRGGLVLTPPPVVLPAFVASIVSFLV